MVISFRPVHPSKILYPSLLTLPRSTDVSFLLSANASLAIAITVCPSMDSGTTRFVSVPEYPLMITPSPSA